MQALLANKCINYVAYDEGSGSQTGEVRFYNGEVYDGELQNGQPKGWGKLLLTDGSYYEGIFDSNGMKEGKFIHFSRDCLEGNFVRDRFENGTLHFCDGDSLKGEWGNERAKWVLKRGELFNEENCHLVKFDNEFKPISYNSKNKEVFKFDDKLGFHVKYARCLVPGKDTIKNLIYTADGTTQYENRISNKRTEKVVNKFISQMPFTKIEQFDDEVLKKTLYHFCYGFSIETGRDNYSARLTFKDLDNITADGQFEMGRLTLKFTGEMRYKNENIGTINIKKSTFNGLKIKIDDKEFDHMNSFHTYIAEICADNFGDVTVHKGNQPSVRKKSMRSAEVMKDMISDIKEHNNCVIM